MKNINTFILTAALFLTPAVIFAQDTQPTKSEEPAQQAPAQKPAEQAPAQTQKQQTPAKTSPAQTAPAQPAAQSEEDKPEIDSAVQVAQSDTVKSLKEIKVDRAMIKIEAPEIKIEVPAVTLMPIAPVDTITADSTDLDETEVVAVATDKPIKLEHSFYFSTRFEMDAAKILNLFSKDAYSTDEFGLSSELGYMINKIFFSGSISFLPEFIGGGASFGARAQPREKIQVITGGTGGYWEEDDNKYFAGAFAKVLLGKRKSCEIQNRVIFGYGDINGKKHVAAVYEIGLGFSITRK